MPTLKASALNGVTNLDVQSNIVLNYSQAVTALAGKYIHIVNDGGPGFHGESTTNTLDILVTDGSAVTVSGGKVTINPAADLDLANNYHITIDAGAFVSATGSVPMAAFDGTTALHFSTVTPGTGASGTSGVANAAASQAMDSSGGMTSSSLWLDIEAIGSPSNAAGTPLDLSGGKYVLVAKDYDPTGADAGSGYDGIKTGDFYVAANNFGADDRIYIDNQSAAKNELSLTGIVNTGAAPTTVQFAGNTGLGGFVDMTLAGSAAGYDTFADMQKYLNPANPAGSPVISA
jgi:hypothetical protein